jgi:hypothetical protein
MRSGFPVSSSERLLTALSILNETSSIYCAQLSKFHLRTGTEPSFRSIVWMMSRIMIISIVGIATAFGLVDRGVEVRVPVGSRILTSPYCPDRLWGPTNLLSSGYWASFPGGKANHSRPTSAEVKKTWIYTATLPYAFTA